MRRRRAVKSLPSDSSDDEPLSKVAAKKRKESSLKDDDSSSESDIENYLQPADKIDLSSEFFNPTKEPQSSFSQIEKNILSGATRLTDSESEDEAKEEFSQPTPSTSKLNFNQLHEYTRKIEEAKRHVEEYNARKKLEQKEMNVENLLAAGEGNKEEKVSITEKDLHSSDFESCSDSGNEGWEEVKENKEKKSVPKEGLQITVGLPNPAKKRKEVDVVAAIKRRINKVRKDNQVLVHKVHLLCWIAHGNFVNTKINSQNVLGMALSLLPSENCYPPNRTDLKYLEQVTKWFKNNVENVEKAIPQDKSLDELLLAQITKKEAYNKNMLVYIFVAIMRSLGIACRLVLSFQVESLRPPSSELLSLSTKESTQKGKEMKIKEQGKAKTGKTVNIQNDKKEEKIVEFNGKKQTKPRGLQLTKSTDDDTKMIASEKAKAQPNAKALKTVKTRAENLESNNKEKSRRKSTKTDKDKEVDSTPGKINGKTTPKSRNTKTIKDASKSPNTDKNISQKDIVMNKQNDHKVVSRPKRGVVSSSSKNLNGNGDKEDKLKSTKSIKARKGTTTDENDVAVAKSLKKKSVRSDSEEPKSKAVKTSISKRTKSKSTIPQMDGANDECPTKPNLKKLKQKQPPSCPIKTHPKRLKSIAKYKDSDSEEDFSTPRSPFTVKTNSPTANRVNLRKLRNHVPKKADVTEDVKNLVKKSIRQHQDLDVKKKVKKRKSGQDSDNDSDYVPEAIQKKRRESQDEFTPEVKVKRRVHPKGTPEEKVKKKKGIDVWAEVFCEDEEKWICVDVVKGEIHCIKELYNRASHPVSYIVAWNNNNTLKDVTKRYCPLFNTITRKLRIDTKWWSETLNPFIGTPTARDKEEEDQFERQHLEKPLPKSIAEYKNHPLYVLPRHLLKFEALYPPDTPTLGFIRNEPVYSRQCVYTLHSREIWLKHAKVVKPGEEPYKIVKARPKWDKLSSSLVTGDMLEIFGPWQTMDYEPPTAENGVVPRNAFGNVELFKPCMLPKKTVHLKLPGLNKIARKMNIDCAAALVGFDFHGGFNHPTYDGYVVCEEFADQLVIAWDNEQEEIEKREQEKLDKRVYGNWKKLIRGLLIRERLKIKYDLPDSSGTGAKKAEGKGLPRFATKK